MDNIRQIVLQEENEARYSRKFIDQYITDEVTNSTLMQEKIVQGVLMLEEYVTKQYSYESKNKRIAQLKDLDLTELVTNIFIGVAYFQKPELYTSVTAQMAGRLGFSDKAEAITTVAEIMAILCATDAYDITKVNKMASLMLVSRVPLTNALIKFIEESQYLPPMVCVPNELVNNYSSGYLGHNDSLILGKGNHHDGDICLDVLNLVNKVALKLDTQFLSTVEEDPTKEFTVEWAHKKAAEKGNSITNAEAKARVTKAIEQWHSFKKQSYQFYSLMNSQGNEFYLTNKVDKRGRIYSQGYHINTQGTSFKKAMVELSNEELVTGMP